MADLRSTLFVGNLSVFCTEQEIDSLFSTYGLILEIRMAKSEDKTKHLSYGFVKFASVASAQLALHELNGAILCGRPLKIGKAFSRSNKKLLGLPPQEPEYSTASVHVTFLSHQLFRVVNEESLRVLFSQFGPVVDAVICKSNVDPAQGRQSGYGFIHFPGTLQGIEASFRAAEMLADVMLDAVNYKCKISHHLEKHLSPSLSLTQPHTHTHAPSLSLTHTQPAVSPSLSLAQPFAPAQSSASVSSSLSGSAASSVQSLFAEDALAAQTHTHTQIERETARERDAEDAFSAFSGLSLSHHTSNSVSSINTLKSFNAHTQPGIGSLSGSLNGPLNGSLNGQRLSPNGQQSTHWESEHDPLGLRPLSLHTPHNALSQHQQQQQYASHNAFTQQRVPLSLSRTSASPRHLSFPHNAHTQQPLHSLSHATQHSHTNNYYGRASVNSSGYSSAGLMSELDYGRASPYNAHTHSRALPQSHTQSHTHSNASAHALPFTLFAQKEQELRERERGLRERERALFAQGLYATHAHNTPSLSALHDNYGSSQLPHTTTHSDLPPAFLRETAIERDADNASLSLNAYSIFPPSAPLSADSFYGTNFDKFTQSTGAPNASRKDSLSLPFSLSLSEENKSHENTDAAAAIATN